MKYSLLFQTSRLKLQKLNSRYLIVDAILLYFIRTRDVVELLTELCVLPVVHRLTRRRTAAIARRHTLDSWSDGVYRLVRWWHPTKNFIVVWFHPKKLAHLPWPTDISNRQTNAENADRDLETHVGSTAAFSELACCIQRHTSLWLTNC